MLVLAISKHNFCCAFLCLKNYETVLEYSLSVICLFSCVFQIQLRLGSQSSVALRLEKNDQRRSATGQIEVLLYFLHNQSFGLEFLLSR